MTELNKISVEQAVWAGLALHRDGRLEESAKVFRNILDVVPDQPDAINFYGILMHQLGDNERAIELVSRAVELEPDNPRMRSILGTMQLELGRNAEAEQAFRKAIELDPEFADAYYRLAELFQRKKKSDEAQALLNKALKLNPRLGQAWLSLGSIHAARQEWGLAIEYLEKAVENSDKEAFQDDVTQVLARVLTLADRAQEAENVLRNWLVRKPDDPIALHMLAAVTGDTITSRASVQFVRATFDQFAFSFDRVLANLEYAAPSLVGECVKQLIGKPCGDMIVCDVGCGTGLVAEFLKPYAAELTGVDLSPGMLKKASQRGLYDELFEEELTVFLNATGRRFDLITCVDAFIYFGALDEALAACCKALKSGGRLCFTLEKNDSSSDERGYKLEHHGRFAHRQSHIVRLLLETGFSNVRIEEVCLRLENKLPATGMLVAAQKLDRVGERTAR